MKKNSHWSLRKNFKTKKPYLISGAKLTINGKPSMKELTKNKINKTNKKAKEKGSKVLDLKLKKKRSLKYFLYLFKESINALSLIWHLSIST